MIQEYLFADAANREAVEKGDYLKNEINLEIEEIENSDCWIAKYSLPRNDEAAAKALSGLNEYVEKQFHPTVLTNDSSAYFNKSLYPLMNEFERKLRKLLYLKSALCKDEKETDIIKNLESMDLGEIFALLLVDQEYNKQAKQAINDKSRLLTKSEMISLLEKLEEHPHWDAIIGVNAAPELRTKFLNVKEYRNDVMHAHNMDTKAFNSAQNLIKKVNVELSEEIGKIIGETEDGETPVATTNQTFNSAINRALKELVDLRATNFNIPKYTVGSLSLPIEWPAKENSLSEIIEKVNLYQKQLDQIQNSLQPTLEQLAASQQTFDQYKNKISPALVQLQNSMESLRPDTTVEEALKQLEIKK